MTKKNYEAAAKVIRENYSNQQFVEVMITSFIEFFAADNPRFNEDKFRKACHGS